MARSRLTTLLAAVLLATAAHGNPDGWREDETQALWQAFLRGAPNGDWTKILSGYELRVVRAGDSLIWTIEAPDGTLIGEGQVSDVDGVPAAWETVPMELSFVCTSGVWVPWVVLPNGEEISLAPWIEVEELLEFTWDCDPHEGMIVPPDRTVQPQTFRQP